MSFSSDQKTDIIAHSPRTTCCKRALLQGMLLPRARTDGKSVSVSVQSAEVAEFLCRLVEEMYGKRPSVLAPKEGGRRKLLMLESSSLARYLDGISAGAELFNAKCPMCQSAFLRGIFLSCGRVSDPSRQFSLEFSVSERREAVCSLMEDLSLTPRISEKPSETVIYFRKGSHLEDFFALAGMNNTAFSLMNAKINSEIRNNVNRITNCTTNNIDRAVAASMKQIALLEELQRRGLLSQLPDELADTARLRLAHRDKSLSQLAALTSPRVSKSGLSHRLARISQLAESMLNK